MSYFKGIALAALLALASLAVLKATENRDSEMLAECAKTTEFCTSPLATKYPGVADRCSEHRSYAAAICTRAKP